VQLNSSLSLPAQAAAALTVALVVVNADSKVVFAFVVTSVTEQAASRKHLILRRLGAKVREIAKPVSASYFHKRLAAAHL
jgi:hypothetical protein